MIQRDNINPRMAQEKKDEVCAMLNDGKPLNLIAETLNIPIKDLITMSNAKH